jgi:hypothetical protein
MLCNHFSHYMAVGTNINHSMAPWEAARRSGSQEFPNFYGTQRLITVFTRSLQWTLSWARRMQSVLLHPASLKSIFNTVLPLCLRLPAGLSFLLTKILRALTCPSSLTWWRVQNYEAHYAVFSNLLPFHSSLVQIFSSGFCSQVPTFNQLLQFWFEFLQKWL